MIDAMKLALWHEAMAKEPNRNQAKREKHEATAKFIRQAIARAESTLEAEKQEPIGEVESSLRFTGGFHVKLRHTATMPEVGTKIYTHPYTGQPKQDNTDLDAICQDLQEMTYTQAMRIAELEAERAACMDYPGAEVQP